MNRIDAAVVGAGVIGLAVAREPEMRGLAVAFVEPHGIGSRSLRHPAGRCAQRWGTNQALLPSVTGYDHSALDILGILGVDRFAAARLVLEPQLV